MPVPAHDQPNLNISLDITGMSDTQALAQIGDLINASGDAISAPGTDRAFTQLDELEKRTLAPELAALARYFRANAWDNRIKIAHGESNTWAWEQPERQEQILALRQAMAHAGFSKLHPFHQCQIFTNLANNLSTIGRFIEAIQLWDCALGVNSRFGMARGNRGVGLSRYGAILYDRGHAAVMLAAAHKALRSARTKSAWYDHAGAKAYFKAEEDHIYSRIPVAKLQRRIDLHNHSLGRGAPERRYRTWCLLNRLFINPLNDIGPLPIAAQDVLTLPSIVRPISEDGVPAIIGFFNQLKQEFVSARYLCYEGMHSSGIHFSDLGVRLYNTLDYPAYSLSAEKVRAAFRIAYSLFDKLGYFLNDYLELAIETTQVSFRSIWYDPPKRRGTKSLRPKFIDYQNWPLRGLFWLSKDFFEERFRASMDPDSADLNTIRNHLEHKYLQLHVDWAPSTSERLATNELSYSISTQDFEAKTVRLLQLTRAALIYLSLAIHREERMRQPSKGNEDKSVVNMALDMWDDAWKRRDL